MYISTPYLRQRGPVDQVESIDAPEGLMVDFDTVISSEIDETHTNPSIGVDRVTRYPARVGDQPAIFERRTWLPAWGYFASGDEDSILPAVS